MWKSICTLLVQPITWKRLLIEHSSKKITSDHLEIQLNLGEELDEIKDLLETKEIRKISFVFSDDNQIVSDALTGQLYSNLSGIDYFYDDLMRRQNDLRMIWELCDDRIMLLSCYLLDKVEKLRRELDFTVNQRLDIDVKIYHRNEKTFKKAHNDLFGLRHHHLN